MLQIFNASNEASSILRQVSWSNVRYMDGKFLKRSSNSLRFGVPNLEPGFTQSLNQVFNCFSAPPLLHVAAYTHCNVWTQAEQFLQSFSGHLSFVEVPRRCSYQQPVSPVTG